MDELGGWLIGIILAIVAAIAAIKFLFLALGYTFVALSGAVGHPIILILLFGGLGAAGGLIQLSRRKGRVIARSSDDYAEIGPFRMVPEQWAVLVVVLFVLAVGLYGRFVL